MYQEITLVGHCGRDPAMKYTQAGVPVTDFSMATSEKWNDGDGNPQERTTWWKVTFWRRQAEVANEFLKKGSLVMVKGVMNVDPETGQPRIWTDRDGNPRCSLEVTGRMLKLLGNRSGGSSGPRDEDVPAEADVF